MGMLQGSVEDALGKPLRTRIGIAGPLGPEPPLDSGGGGAFLQFLRRALIQIAESRSMQVAASRFDPSKSRIAICDAGEARNAEPLALPATDPSAEDSVEVNADAQTAGIFLISAENGGQGGLATLDTGSAFASNNLPSLAERGIVERPEEYLWFTRDTAELSGLIVRWTDFFAATGQWAYQTIERCPSDTPIGSRLLFANTRGQVRAGARDRLLDALYSGSRVDLTDGGFPSVMETILANHQRAGSSLWLFHRASRYLAH